MFAHIPVCSKYNIISILSIICGNSNSTQGLKSPRTYVVHFKQFSYTLIMKVVYVTLTTNYNSSYIELKKIYSTSKDTVVENTKQNNTDNKPKSQVVNQILISEFKQANEECLTTQKPGWRKLALHAVMQSQAVDHLIWPWLSYLVCLGW